MPPHRGSAAEPGHKHSVLRLADDDSSSLFWMVVCIGLPCLFVYFLFHPARGLTKSENKEKLYFQQHVFELSARLAL